jgi:drug/metabolite transporter (DMT)-like permease
LFVLMLLRGDALKPPPLGQLLMVGAVQTLGFQAQVQWALVHVGDGKTAMLAYTMPFWVVGVAWVVLRVRPARVHLAAAGMAFAGLLLMLEPWQRMGTLGSSLLAIGGGLCWAIGTVLSKRVFTRGEAGVLSLSAWQMLVGSIGLVAVALLVDEPPVQWTAGFVAAVAYNGILASGLAWLLWTTIVDRLPTTAAGLSSLVVPVMGVLFAWALLGEAPSPAEWAGIGLMAAALGGIGFWRMQSD